MQTLQLLMQTVAIFFNKYNIKWAAFLNVQFIISFGYYLKIRNKILRIAIRMK